MCKRFAQKGLQFPIPVTSAIPLITTIFPIGSDYLCIQIVFMWFIVINNLLYTCAMVHFWS